MENAKHKFTGRSFFILIICAALIALQSCTSVSTSKSNLDYKDPEDPAGGGFVWGQNDKKTGLPEEELSNEEIIRRQKEVLKRQEIEKDRLERERQDILRQEHYNRQLKHLQTGEQPAY